YSAQLLRPGEETELKRETAGTFYVAIEGSGATEVGGKRFEWTQNDIFVVPNFLWRRHINTGKSDAVIYSVSDAALMKHSGQYYAQGGSKDGKVTELTHCPPRRRLRPERPRSGRFCLRPRFKLRIGLMLRSIAAPQDHIARPLGYGALRCVSKHEAARN